MTAPVGALAGFWTRLSPRERNLLALLVMVFFIMAIGEARPFYISRRPPRSPVFTRIRRFETSRTIRYAGKDRYKPLKGIGCA